MTRKIIHVDMDAFYASVEILDDPSLAGKPLVVGGRPDSRGVVATASYEARKFGVRSAMASSKAKRLCPQAIFVPPRFERYREVSLEIRAIMRRYTDQLEPLSLDEAYLDVTDNPFKLYAVEIAKRIRAEIRGELGLTASAGVAPNKMLAKIASDLRKPNGLSVIRPQDVAQFVEKLPVAKIHGIGPVTARKLAEQGIRVCADVTARPEGEVIALFGASFGGWLYRRAQGLDERPVETTWERKSYGEERTFQRDLATLDQMVSALKEMGLSLSETLRESGRKGKTVTLKARYPDFTTVTRATTLPFPTDAADVLIDAAVQMLYRTEALKRRVRLLGISVSKLAETETPARGQARGLGFVQRSLFGD